MSETVKKSVDRNIAELPLFRPRSYLTAYAVGLGLMAFAGAAAIAPSAVFAESVTVNGNNGTDVPPRR
jgi:hypothetical protein